MKRAPAAKINWSRSLTLGCTCRVCGLSFRSRRFDAITCSSTCRQRFKRGHAFAYLEGMTNRKQKSERERHAALDEHIVARRDWTKIVRSERAEKRAKQERERQQKQAE